MTKYYILDNIFRNYFAIFQRRWAALPDGLFSKQFSRRQPAADICRRLSALSGGAAACLPFRIVGYLA